MALQSGAGELRSGMAVAELSSGDHRFLIRRPLLKLCQACLREPCISLETDKGNPTLAEHRFRLLRKLVCAFGDHRWRRIPEKAAVVLRKIQRVEA